MTYLNLIFKENTIKERISPSLTVEFKKYSLFKIALFSVFNFGYCVVFGFISGIMFPEDVIFFVGDKEKPKVLGMVFGIAAAFSFIIGPLSGFICDKTGIIKIFGKEIGKRRPYIYVSYSLFLLTLIGRVPFKKESDHSQFNFIIYSILSIVGMSLMIISSTAYRVLNPDLFHESQFDYVSAVLGFSQLLGGAVAIGVYGILWSYLSYEMCILSVVIVGFITMLSLIPFGEEENLKKKKLVEMEEKKKKKEKKEKREPHLSSSSSPKSSLYLSSSSTSTPTVRQRFRIFGFVSSFLRPFRSFNYSIVFFSRFIFMFSIATLQSFLLYFLRDCVKVYTFPTFLKISDTAVQNEGEAQSIVGSIVFFSGLISSVAGPLLSRKYIRRKYVISLSGVVMIISFLGFIIFREHYFYIVLFSIPMGFGLGSFYSVDVSLVNSILPNPEEAAKDLSIFDVGSSLPFSIASPIMGFLISWGNDYIGPKVNVDEFGYYIMFVTSIAFQIVGSVLILFVRQGKDQQKVKKIMVDLVDEEFLALSDEELRNNNNDYLGKQYVDSEEDEEEEEGIHNNQNNQHVVDVVDDEEDEIISLSPRNHQSFHEV